jgi:hypothetical protein
VVPQAWQHPQRAQDADGVHRSGAEVDQHLAGGEAVGVGHQELHLAALVPAERVVEPRAVGPEQAEPLQVAQVLSPAGADVDGQGHGERGEVGRGTPRLNRLRCPCPTGAVMCHRAS